MAFEAAPFTPVRDGLRVAVRLTPKASRNAVTGIALDAAGTARIKAGVTAAPERGAANAALIGLLAGEWRLPRSTITIAAGATGRNKVLHLAGDPNELAAALSGWTDRIAKRGAAR